MDDCSKELIRLETERLSVKYGKSFLDCSDLTVELGLGLENARRLMNTAGFPAIRIGKRQIVYIPAFVGWFLDLRRYTT